MIVRNLAPCGPVNHQKAVFLCCAFFGFEENNLKLRQNVVRLPGFRLTSSSQCRLPIRISKHVLSADRRRHALIRSRRKRLIAMNSLKSRLRDQAKSQVPSFANALPYLQVSPEFPGGLQTCSI